MVITHSQSHGNSCIIRCDGCLMNISSIMWIQCVQCRIDICPLCTIQRTQIRTHEYTHKYRIVESLSFEADSEGWQMIEELLFVDGLIMHGIGNWEDVAAYIGRKTPEEVKQHFSRIFKQQDIQDLEGEPVQNVQSLPLSQEISGYMPLRQDFEVEYSNDAEISIKEISFSKADTPLEKETKEILLEAYRNVLLQRKLFRHLIFKKGLLAAKQHTLGEKSLCAAGKDLLAKMKPLLKILSVKEYLDLFQGLYLELLIKKKISGMYSTQDTAKKGEVPLPKKEAPIVDEVAVQYLSESEKSFCNTVSVPYAIYYSLRETAILYRSVAETEKRNILKVFQGLTEQKLSQILNYFIQNRWVEPPVSSLV
ncbi:transcriptional adapter 2-beta [Nematocida minor]|uniref:transcriptional adapter 2-beta n=1 Tax=Nematocida minor TaxID=1912983 RepID=UPI0022203C2F|nr:transcriptional adapter 2-beta [Nematocida minor]KAI5190820.1 transcriptional adapter 2-beta [Nematocida minor]